MSKLKIERIGGLAGFGGNSQIRSLGEIDLDELSNEDKQVIENLFASNANEKGTLARDTFRYRISRVTSKGIESIEADEENIPGVVKQSVKDEFI